MNARAHLPCIRSIIRHGLTMATFILTLNACAGVPPYPPVSGFNLNRYLGKWYEIARMPSSFERRLMNVTATYSLRPDGKVKVFNEGYIDAKTGKYSKITGKAKIAGKPDEGHLRVSFFGPFYADYIITDLDSAYQTALIVSSPRYMWILSREPKIDDETIQRLVNKAKVLGVDTGKLEFVGQEW